MIFRGRKLFIEFRHLIAKTELITFWYEILLRFNKYDVNVVLFANDIYSIVVIKRVKPGSYKFRISKWVS